LLGIGRRGEGGGIKPERRGEERGRPRKMEGGAFSLTEKVKKEKKCISRTKEDAENKRGEGTDCFFA